MSLRVAVCVATYRRPELLRLLLESLTKQRFPATPPELRVVVVDNDANASARKVVEEARTGFPWPLTYAVAPEPNISVARNLCLKAAREAPCDFIAVIDDDEAASPHWLAELLETQERYGADAVVGPVRPRFEEGVPAWIRRGGYFASPVHPTGKRIGYGLTNNVLLRETFFRTKGLQFDPRFGRTGGGDTLFFMRALEEGAKVVWSAAAEVEEFIPKARARAGWILQRAFRVGNAYVRCRRALLPRSSWMPGTVGLAAARIGAGMLLLVPGLIRGRRGVVSALRLLMHGFGSLAGLVGYTHQEYGTVHGS